MNLRRFTGLTAVLFAAAALTGCSLLKVSVATGDPLPREDVRTRTMTRGFYYDFASEVARTADSIVASSDAAGVRLAALRWKIRATRAGVDAAMQGIPDVALADLWILCRRQQAAFAAAPDSLLFGAQSDLARRAAERLDARAGRLARQVLAPERYALMERFVGDYLCENSQGEQEAPAANTTLAWIEFLEKNGVKYDYATGSISEVLADVNDRLSGQTRQFSNSIGWSKDLIQMQLQQDSLHLHFTAQLDSLERGFSRMAAVAEQVPQISDHMMQELSRQVTQVIYSFNASVDNAFSNLDAQRAELQKYISSERAALLAEARQAASDAVQSMLDGLPALIGKVLLYVVLALAVLIGGPFVLGLWLGGVRQRAREKRKNP